jgi:hypothetical protein
MQLGELERMDLRSVWKNEAYDFTPWLAENIDRLGDSLGLELELVEQEKNVGDFALDLLARDLGSGRDVVIENQFSQTDHDHLGKLLTYAGGVDAGTVIWLAEKVRDEHRQALDWLNQRTDSETQFFAVVVEVLRIGESLPAIQFRPVVFPNEWQKTRRQTARRTVSKRGEAYREFFQGLIDRLREEHHFTGARAGQPQNWYSFASGKPSFTYGASFALGGRVRVEVYLDSGDADANKEMFDSLAAERDAIESEYEATLEWERLDEKRASRIAAYRSGSVDDDPDTLAEIADWMIDNLRRMKAVLGPRLSDL